MQYDENFFDSTGTMLPGVQMGQGDAIVIINGKVTIAKAFQVGDAPQVAVATSKPKRPRKAPGGLLDAAQPRQAKASRSGTPRRQMQFIDDKRIPSDPQDEADRKKFSKPQRRPPVKPIKVTCVKCNKRESISPSLLSRENGYICNDCISR